LLNVLQKNYELKSFLYMIFLNITVRICPKQKRKQGDMGNKQNESIQIVT